MADVQAFLTVGTALLVALALGEGVERTVEPAIRGGVLPGVPLGTAVLGVGEIAYGVFIPLFFVSVCAQMDHAALLTFDPFVLAVVATGALVTVGGSHLGARIGGHPEPEALVVDAGMLPRAGVEFVVITGALAAGIVDERLFSAVLALVLVSVFATPILLRLSLENASGRRGGAEDATKSP